MIKIAIAIPTYNREKYLLTALEAIQKLQQTEQIKADVFVSNIASTDGTHSFLENAQKSGLLRAYNKPDERILCNPLFLSEIIPEEYDWVWFHGDDDVIKNPLALDVIHSAIKANPDCDLIITPMIKRQKQNSPIYTCDTIFKLANHYGLTELLGWMSQIIIKRCHFKEFGKYILERAWQIRKTEDFTKYKFSAFPHTDFILENLSNAKAVLINTPIIDEQVEPAQLLQHNQSRKIESAFRYVLFNHCKYSAFFLKANKIKVSANFYRYVNKSIIDLMLNITAGDIIARKTTTSEIAFRISTIRATIETIQSNPLCNHLIISAELIELAQKTYPTISSNLTQVLDSIFLNTKKPSYPFENF